jgi:hypothetical protein
VHHPDHDGGIPLFEIVENKIYTTAEHPAGRKSSPWFKITGDLISATEYYPYKHYGLPLYKIISGSIYTTANHPDGNNSYPWFEISE